MPRSGVRSGLHSGTLARRYEAKDVHSGMLRHVPLGLVLMNPDHQSTWRGQTGAFWDGAGSISDLAASVFIFRRPRSRLGSEQIPGATTSPRLDPASCELSAKQGHRRCG